MDRKNLSKMTDKRLTSLLASLRSKRDKLIRQRETTNPNTGKIKRDQPTYEELELRKEIKRVGMTLRRRRVKTDAEDVARKKVDITKYEEELCAMRKNIRPRSTP